MGGHLRVGGLVIADPALERGLELVHQVVGVLEVGIGGFWAGVSQPPADGQQRVVADMPAQIRAVPPPAGGVVGFLAVHQVLQVGQELEGVGVATVVPAPPLCGQPWCGLVREGEHASPGGMPVALPGVGAGHQAAAANEHRQCFEPELALTDSDPPLVGRHRGHLVLMLDAVDPAADQAAVLVDAGDDEQIAMLASQGPGRCLCNLRTLQQAVGLHRVDGVLGNVDRAGLAVFRASLNRELGRGPGLTRADAELGQQHGRPLPPAHPRAQSQVGASPVAVWCHAAE
jgi:hypothetical protein